MVDFTQFQNLGPTQVPEFDRTSRLERSAGDIARGVAVAAPAVTQLVQQKRQSNAVEGFIQATAQDFQEAESITNRVTALTSDLGDVDQAEFNRRLAQYNDINASSRLSQLNARVTKLLNETAVRNPNVAQRLQAFVTGSPLATAATAVEDNPFSLTMQAYQKQLPGAAPSVIESYAQLDLEAKFAETKLNAGQATRREAIGVFSTGFAIGNATYGQFSREDYAASMDQALATNNPEALTTIKNRINVEIDESASMFITMNGLNGTDEAEEIREEAGRVKNALLARETMSVEARQSLDKLRDSTNARVFNEVLVDTFGERSAAIAQATGVANTMVSVLVATGTAGIAPGSAEWKAKLEANIRDTSVPESTQNASRWLLSGNAELFDSVSILKGEVAVSDKGQVTTSQPSAAEKTTPIAASGESRVQAVRRAVTNFWDTSVAPLLGIEKDVTELGNEVAKTVGNRQTLPQLNAAAERGEPVPNNIAASALTYVFTRGDTPDVLQDEQVAKMLVNYPEAASVYNQSAVNYIRAQLREYDRQMTDTNAPVAARNVGETIGTGTRASNLVRVTLNDLGQVVVKEQFPTRVGRLLEAAYNNQLKAGVMTPQQAAQQVRSLVQQSMAENPFLIMSVEGFPVKGVDGTAQDVYIGRRLFDETDPNANGTFDIEGVSYTLRKGILVGIAQ